MPTKQGDVSLVNRALEGEMRERRAGEGRYRAFFETAAIGAAECDPLDARFLRVNDALCRITGYTRDDLLARRVTDLTHPADRAAEDAARGRLVRGEVPSYRLQTRVVRADGRVIWAQVDAALARDAAGAPLHTVLLVEDVTARRRAEDALRESEERFRIMADTAPVLLWMAGPDGLCTFFNKPWLDFTGRTLEQEMGNGWAEGVHPEDLGRCLDTYRSAFEARRPFTMEYRLHHAAGTYRWVLDNGVPHFLPTGSFAGYIGSAIDITGRKMAEEALRRSEARFRRLDCSGMIGLIVADEGGRVVEANDAFLALVGYTREDLAAGRVDLAAMTPPEYAAVDAEAAQRLRIARACQPYEQEYVRKDGRRVPVLVGGAVLEEGAGGAASTVILFVLDLTERKRAEAALRELAVRRQTEAALRESEARLQRANAALERASRLKSTFLANMSHEIRTPLNGVLGLAHLLRDTPLDARQQEYAAGIQSSGAALLALISDILDLSKIEAGEMALERAPVDLRALVADVVEVVAAQVRAKELELVSFVDPAVPPVLMGDPTRLRQVLLNLVGNAVKFTERGGIAVRVEPANPAAGRSADEEGGLLIQGTVEDTGIGVAAEAQARLFDAFAQADETTTRRYGGTGLGLAICKQVVELMGGEIGVESVLKVGSTFQFTARLGDAEAGGTPAPIPAWEWPELDGTALLVGGPAPVRAALRDQLAAWGLRVEAAADAVGALDALWQAAARGGGYAVALVDEQLPDMSGVALARRLRGVPATPPLLLLTARDRAAADALPAGIAARLANPVRPAQLYGAVAPLVGRTAPLKGVGTQDRLSTVAPAPARAPGGRILVAEDNPVNQLVTVHLIEALGYQVETVEDGRGAVTAVERGAYDLVLMDCHMPTMDGFTATAEIRRWDERSGRHTPIIALTADALSGDAEKCLAAGMDDYLAKPVTPERLLEVVARWTS